MCYVFFKNTLWIAFAKILKSTLIFIISQIADTLFFDIKLTCLAENFKAITWNRLLSWISSKLKKLIFWKKAILPLSYSCIWNLAHFLQPEYNKKMRVKRSRNVKYLFYKNNAEKNGMFHMQIMLKGGNKHTQG